MIAANQVRPGMIIEFEGQVYYVMEAMHRTPGNLRAFMQIKMRNIRNNNQIEQRFSTSDRLEKVTLETHKMQFLYREGDAFHFMNTATYDQVQLSAQELGDTVQLLLPDAVIDVQFYEGKAIGVSMPKTMDFKVVEAEPAVKKQTASASYKSAKIETGLTVKVPAFVSEGDVIRIDPSTHEYLERVSK